MMCRIMPIIHYAHKSTSPAGGTQAIRQKMETEFLESGLDSKGSFGGVRLRLVAKCRVRPIKIELQFLRFGVKSPALHDLSNSRHKHLTASFKQRRRQDHVQNKKFIPER